MLTFMLKQDNAFKLLHFNANCTILGTVFFFRKDLSPLSAYNEMVAFSFIKGVVHLNLNRLLVKHQIDNPSSGAVTGGKLVPSSQER